MTHFAVKKMLTNFVLLSLLINNAMNTSYYLYFFPFNGEGGERWIVSFLVSIFISLSLTLSLLHFGDNEEIVVQT